MSAGEGSRLEDLVLARLLAAGESSMSLSKLKETLEPLAKRRWSGASLSEALGRTLESLEAAGLATRNKRSWKSTEAGCNRARNDLGIDGPAQPLPWTSVKNGLLVARALGLRNRAAAVLDRLKTADGLRAALLRGHFDLPIDETPTLKQAKDALGWKLLEHGAAAEVIARLAGRESFKTDTVLAALVYTHLKLDTTPDEKGVVDLLLASALGRPVKTAHKLREAVLQRLLDAAAVTASASQPQPVSVPPPAHATTAADLAEFARRAVTAARLSPTGRFGQDRVFISHAWRQFQRTYPGPSMTEAEFKQRLVEANQARHLSLVRADLAPLLDPMDVLESAVEHLSTTFHLICV
jgi:hypothetical protein